MALLMPLAAGALVMLALAMRGLALPFAAARRAVPRRGRADLDGAAQLPAAGGLPGEYVPDVRWRPASGDLASVKR